MPGPLAQQSWSARKRIAREMFARGMTDEEIAQALAVGPETVRGWRRAAGPALDAPQSPSSLKPGRGRPRKNPTPATGLQTSATITGAVTTKTAAQADVEWLARDMERRRERARIERERLFG